MNRALPLIDNQTVAKVNLVLLVGVVCLLLKGVWLLSDINTKVQVLWSEHHQGSTACIATAKGSQP